MEKQLSHWLKSKQTTNILLLLLSTTAGTLLYLGFFINLLPRFFSNMENLEKNLIALLIIILTTYTLLKIALKIDTKADRSLLLAMYLIVLTLGLLRPDQTYLNQESLFSWNPLAFISDIKNDTTSFIVMIINLITFMPMYFLLTHSTRLKTFKTKFITFQLFIFTFELLQALFKVGRFDLSDIVLYNIGFFAGTIIALPILKLIKNPNN